MNFIAPGAQLLMREIPLSRLALAPENVRKTPPDPRTDAELKASIAALGLLENLVVRADEPDETGGERYAVVAGGRRLKAMQALVEDEVIDADHLRAVRHDRRVRRKAAVGAWSRKPPSGRKTRPLPLTHRLSRPAPGQGPVSRDR